VNERERESGVVAVATSWAHISPLLLFASTAF
jgi:hypothetical protein